MDPRRWPDLTAPRTKKYRMRERSKHMQRTDRKKIAATGLSLWLAVMLWPALSHAIEWPQEIEAEEGSIVIYQPQPEALAGNRLKGRAAMALQLKGREEPIFGALWFESAIDTDRADGTALIRDLKVTEVRWPESRDADEQRFTAVVEGAVPAAGFQISLDALAASLKTAEIEQASIDNLKNDPPAIVFREELAVLLLYDGDPRYSEVENSPYERVLNSPMAVVRKKRSKNHWLSSGKFWYEANDPMGPWTPTSSPPRDLVQAMQSADTDESQPDTPPAIVTAKAPTELIVTDGAPDWQALAGNELLYVQNTQSPWLRELSTNNMYLLLSGRWFRSKSQEGPWTFVRSDELPSSFLDIPPASDIGGLRTSVAGTIEAEEAVLDQYIPQTAAIKRDEASLTVEYDGEPRFEAVTGTDVSYAVNTGAQVLRINGRYYAVDAGVWFTSAAATGPWAVADSVPREEIDKIPPSSPVYNTTNVHIYNSTPEVVYVGYTPGYLWSFPYYGAPVYGTGWLYRPYYGHRYYPRPPTWGFNVGYNPWTGWNFGMSWSNGFFRFGMSWGGGYGGSYRPWGCCNGWYGGGHRGPTIINTGDINIGNNINFGNRVEARNRIANSGLSRDRSRENLYKRPENLRRNASRDAAISNLKMARPATDRANNVFADRDGNVAQRVEDGWRTRENGAWSKDTIPAGRPATRPSDRPIGRPETPVTRPATRPATRPSPPVTRPATRPATRPSPPVTRPATRPSPRPSNTMSRPTARPAQPGFNRAQFDRAHMARQRGVSRQMGRPARAR